MTAWTQLTPDEYANVWDRFYSTFEFRPSVKREDWPSIREPTPSITIAISEYYASPSPERFERELAQTLLDAFCSISTRDRPMIVLDWQHPAYWLRPDQVMSVDDIDWPVSVLPNGDYRVFLAGDWSCGIFGHPWEETICIFGQQMLDQVFAKQNKLFDAVIRRNDN